MEEFLYSAGDIARIIIDMKLGCQEENKIINSIWEGEKYFYEAKYRESSERRKFILDVLYHMHYYYEKPMLDREISEIQKQSENTGSNINIEEYKESYSAVDLFFKKTRIRILYGNGKDYVSIKKRTLLAQYDYKRCTQPLISHINRCMLFYHIEMSLSGGIPCDLKTCKSDARLTFRVV